MRNLFYILFLVPLLSFAERTMVDSYGMSLTEARVNAKHGVYKQYETIFKFRWAAKSHYKKYFVGEAETLVDENNDGYYDYAIIDVAQFYDRAGTSDTYAFRKAMASARGSFDTIVFDGNDWTMEWGLRQSSLEDFNVIFEDGMRLIQSTTAWTGNPLHYNTTNEFLTNHPNDTYNPALPGLSSGNDQAVGLLWAFVVDNVTFTCEGSFEGVGVYPQNYPGDDPSPAGTQNTEKGHHFMKYQDVGNMTWTGGYVHNFSDDAFNIIDLKAPVLVQHARMSYNKRLGIQSWSRQGKLTVYKCDISYNGKADIAPVWGTNTRHGATLEPNNEDESEFAEFIGCRFVGNSDSAIGIHAGKIDDSAPIDLDVVVTDSHMEDNGDQADNTRSAAITNAATDIFTTVKGDNPQGGLAIYTGTRVWGDTYGFMTSQHYKGSYKIQFVDTFVYKLSTSAGETNPGTSIVDLNPRSTIPNGSKLADLDFGNITVVHEQDEHFIYLQNFNNMDEIESTVTGSVYFSGPGSKGIWTTDNAITNNATLTQNRVALGDLNSNVANVTANVPNAVKSTSTNGQYTFSFDGAATSYTRAIHYTVSTSGTNADMLTDFELLNGSVTIPAGQTSVTLDVVPRNSQRTGGNRNITLTITPKTDAYTVGSNNTATVVLSDDPLSGTPSAPDPIFDFFINN